MLRKPGSMLCVTSKNIHAANDTEPKIPDNASWSGNGASGPIMSTPEPDDGELQMRPNRISRPSHKVDSNLKASRLLATDSDAATDCDWKRNATTTTDYTCCEKTTSTRHVSDIVA